jgi:RNA polymerase sigma-70 factor (ECF subfamily)
MLKVPNINRINPPMLSLQTPSSESPGAEPFVMLDEAAEGCAPATLVDPQELSPEALVEACKSGSKDAFELLVAHYEKRIFNFLWQMTGNAHDAEDLAQETFVKVYHNLHRFNSTQGFTTWLFTIAKRTAFNHFRRGKRFQELSSSDDPVDFDDPSILLEEKDEKNSLWALAAANVKPEQYEALWLRYGEGFSIAETARILNTNRIRIRVLLYRGRKTLANRLGPSDTQIRQT